MSTQGPSVGSAGYLVYLTPIVNQTMDKAKKIVITTESHEIFILRSGSHPQAVGLCRSCGRDVGMLTLDQAVSESGLRTRVLVNMAEARHLHTIETSSGHLIFCAASIDAISKQEKQK